jgi:hypothetical protein
MGPTIVDRGSGNVENDAVPPDTVHGSTSDKHTFGAGENVSTSILADEIGASS